MVSKNKNKFVQIPHNIAIVENGLRVLKMYREENCKIYGNIFGKAGRYQVNTLI